MASAGRSRKRGGSPARNQGLDDTANRLHSVAIHLLRGLRRVDRESGLSGPRLSALSVIVFRAPVTLTDLASAVHTLSPAVGGSGPRADDEPAGAHARGFRIGGARNGSGGWPSGAVPRDAEGLAPPPGRA